jgi:hypothetical protein
MIGRDRSREDGGPREAALRRTYRLYSLFSLF